MHSLVPQIVSAIQAGQPEQAEQACRQALLELPGDENLLVLLAMALQAQQRLPEAVSVYAELTRLFPASSAHWNNYAVALTQTGELAQAQAACEKAAELEPDNLLTQCQLGALLIDRHQYLAARNLLLQAHTLNPGLPPIRIQAARACCHCHDAEGASELLKPWRSWFPMHDDTLQLELAQVLTLKNDVPAAAEVLEDLLARQPGWLKARLLLASIYERFNRLDEADAVLQPALHSQAGMDAEQRNETDHLLATLALRRKDFPLAKLLLERCGPQDADDDAHWFQLGAVYDKLGDVDAAIAALHEAHRQQARKKQFESPEHYTPHALPMPTDAPVVSAEQFARWPKLIAPDAPDTPIFVVGFPRSGTTLLEQMLDAHPGLQSMDENPFFNSLSNILRQHDARIMDNLSVLRQYDADELRKRYYNLVSERIERRPQTRLIDKNPLNMLWLPFIYRLFPNARFILALRHPCDVILSCYMQSFRSGGLAAACSTLERLAHAYVQVMTRWLEQVAILQPAVFASHYEQLVENFPQQATRIAGFLELEDASPMLGFHQHARGKTYIATPSYSQVIEPVNRRGLNRWHAYRREFEPLLPILEPMLRHWGYAVD